MTTPFVIFALPRSRTAWLSKFLSYRDWHCGHEQLRYMRSFDDIKSWFSQDRTGTIETAAAPWWRLLLKYRPDARVVIIRRNVDEVIESLLRMKSGGKSLFDRNSLEPQIRKLDHKLNQIEKRISWAISISFDDLEKEETCTKIFEHCLPYKHDTQWWEKHKDINIQCSMPALARYCLAHVPQLEKLSLQAKHRILSDLSKRPIRGSGEIIFQIDRFDKFFEDARPLFKEHLVQIGERPDNFLNKNLDLMRALDDVGAMQIVTARCNGRVFGYLMSIISPSLEEPGRLSAVHTTFFTSKEFPGLGLKLQRASLQYLKERGINEVILHAGTRGSGPKMGALYKRLGSENNGQLFRLNLDDK